MDQEDWQLNFTLLLDTRSMDEGPVDLKHMRTMMPVSSPPDVYRVLTGRPARLAG